jgi:hypothetical protein
MASVDTLPATPQRFALVVFYYATGGQGWTNSLGFLNATSHECDNWFSELYDDSNGGIFSFGVLCYNDDNEIVATLRLREYHSLYLTVPCVA